MEFGQEQVLKGELTVLATKNQDKIPKYRDSGQNQDKIPKDRDAGSVFTKCYTGCSRVKFPLWSYCEISCFNRFPQKRS